MKWMFLLSLAVTASAAMSAAQTASAPSNAMPQDDARVQGSMSQRDQTQNQIPAGTVISVELSKSVDAKKVKSGDKIEARTAIDVLSHGKVVIPRNTKIIGHVTEAKAHSKESPDSMIGLAFDRILMKDGRELPIQVGVQAIGRPLQVFAPAENGPTNESSGIPSAGSPSQGVGTMGSGGAMGGTTPARSPSPTSSRDDTWGHPDPSAPPSGSVAPLGPTSQGVVGMKGLSLKTAGQTSIISSEKENVHLDGGTQLILRTQ